MEQIRRYKSLLIAGVALVIIIGITGSVIYALGKAYQSGLSISNNQPIQEIKITKTKKIRKITLKKTNQDACIEVSPDGTVRIYNTCGQQLTEAARLTNLNAIQKLFAQVSEQTYVVCRDDLVNAYQIVVESDQGVETVCVLENNNSGGGVSSNITDIINNILGDLPHPSTSPLPNRSTPPPTNSPYASPPHASPSGNSTPSPSPGASGTPSGFICDYHETTGQNKPYTVSNIVCSTSPSPLP